MKFMHINGTYFRVRKEGSYRNKADYACLGINSKGKRESVLQRSIDQERRYL